jgi:hypothetical protein
LSDIVSQERSFFYPLFLNLVKVISPDFHLLPAAQFIVYALAGFIFFRGLRIANFSQIQALVTALPLLHTQILWRYVHVQVAEILSVSMAILTIAFMFMFVKQTYNNFLLIALSLSLFLTYQTRPSFLFLIPLVPLLTIILLFFFNYHQRVRNNFYRNIVVKILIACFIPYLLFNILRTSLVNTSGVVSFSGNTKIGKNSFLGVNSTVSNDVQIGSYCWISPSSIIGENLGDETITKSQKTEISKIKSKKFFRIT